jgi:hypothetical protein
MTGILDLFQVDEKHTDEIAKQGTAILEIIGGNVGTGHDPDISAVTLATVAATLAHATTNPTLYILRLSIACKLILDHTELDENPEDEDE